MQVADIVSDLTSLQVCDPNAALALVSARPDGIGNGQRISPARREDEDPDLNRANDLLDLHANVKLAHQDGTNVELKAARDAVEKALRSL